MSPSPQAPRSENTDCPFLQEPCPQGSQVAARCQLRVAQDFDPVAKFYENETIHCALCERDFRMADIQRVKLD